MRTDTYTISFPDGDELEVEASEIVASRVGDLLVSRPATGNVPYVIPRGEWSHYVGGLKMFASASRGDGRRTRTKRTSIPQDREWVLQPEEVKKGARFGFTDDGNASRFCEDHDGKLIYATGPGWHRWTGKRWKPIPREDVMKEARATARRIRREGLRVKDHDTAVATVKWAKQSASAARLESMIKLAQGGDDLKHADLKVEVEHLDQNRDAINTASGLVDLRSGKFLTNSRDQFCTRVARAAYDPKADQSEWLKFLRRFVPDKTLREALKRCLGASITGHVPKALFLLLGPDGDNGKTTLLEAVGGALGDYAKTTLESTLTNATAREAGYDLAELRGARFVSWTETREGHGLAAERVKRLTGGDKVKARSPAEKPFEYQAHFSLWMATNHPPVIPAREKAMWKRVWAFPFNVAIPEAEQVSDYGDLLAREHGSGILAWLVEGAKEFYADGCRLGVQPTAMEQQRDDWQDRDDIVKRWLEERTEATRPGREKNSALWADYREWCEENGERAALSTYTAQKFHAELDTHYPRDGRVLDGVATRKGLTLRRPPNGTRV